jgi:hypothetical protein
MDNPGLQNINKMYDKLNYFDQYGGNVMLLIFITIILLIFISYCYVKIHAQPIIDDWPNQRCKPNIIPFAGLITHPEGISAFDYTAQNFNQCTQNILSSITGTALEPLTYIVNIFKNIVVEILNAIQAIRAMFDKVRNMFQEISEEIMGRILNFMIPLQQIIISFKDLLAKVQGVMTAGLFTLLGSFYALQALMGAIAQFIIIILITLAALIVIFWIIPFTWGFAISNTVIFIAISIPLIIILAFFVDVLNVHPGLGLPGAPKGPSTKCFDENTLINMNDGTKKKISEIKIGDLLFENNEVTAIIKVETVGSTIYNLHNIIVSDSHIVKYKNKWIPVSKHEDAFKIDIYQKPYLYCLNTTNKIISIDNEIFTDWDEIYDDDIIQVKLNGFFPIKKLSDIHTFLDSGFKGTTQIKLQNGIYKEIQDIKTGDILSYGEKVYGIVKINGKNLNKQFAYNLGKKLIVEGGPNLTICDKKIKFNTTLTLDNNSKKILDTKNDELYHLLTDKKSFYIEDICFYDYNTAIDIFLEKNKAKLLSMKYV